MEHARLKEIVLDQRETFNRPKQLIERDIELDAYLKTSQVVIISGVRRCGKSSLLYLIKEKLDLQEQDYCYFNLDDERIVDEAEILDQVYRLHLEMHRKEPLFFLDEVQNIPNWEKFVNRLYEKGIKLFITGSNANLLSSEIASALTGRNKVLQLSPFSFKEYLRFIGRDYTLERLSSTQKSFLQGDFNDYLKKGGFPLVIAENDLELINGYFQDILYRDIVARHRLSQVDELKQIALYFASNVGKLFSYATLQQVSGVKSSASVKQYLEYLGQTYLFFYLKKFDYSVKKQIMNPKKVYAVDPAVCHRLGSHFSLNQGRILENVVYLELLRRGKEVFYHQQKKECDFVIKEGLQINAALQVTWEMNTQNTKRELEGLQEAMQVHQLQEGWLLTGVETKTSVSLPDNIKLMPVREWLLAG